MKYLKTSSKFSLHLLANVKLHLSTAKGHFAVNVLCIKNNARCASITTHHTSGKTFHLTSNLVFVPHVINQKKNIVS